VATPEDSELRNLTISDAPKKTQETKKSYLILKYAHDSAKSFLEAFEVVRQERGATKGATTDEEQDLLRMMIVISASGLDSLLKQLIRDTLPLIVHTDETVRDGLLSFASRQLRGDPEDIGTAANHKFLARILIADSQQSQVIEEYIYSLTGSSLQSVSELMKAVNALGIDANVVDVDPNELKPIFDIRNKIIHELDIDFEAARRNRKSRRLNEMIGRANVLLRISEKVLWETFEKVQSAKEDA
jgi:hypothetical protein